MDEMIFGLSLTVFLLSLGLIIGGMRERLHLRDLTAREHQVADMLLSQRRLFPDCGLRESSVEMLVAEVVISSDYLKSFLARLRNLFGGEVRSFQSLLDRARREAILRIQEQARDKGFNAVCNIRLETADVGGRGSNPQNKIVMVAILASGTAYHAKLD